MNARSFANFALPQARVTSLVEPQIQPQSRVQIQAMGVSVVVGDKTLLHPTSCNFKAGEVTVILGPNGAGKSTLMSLLTGERQPHAGCVLWQARELPSWPTAELARQRAFVAQETQVAFDFTVRDVVELGRYPHRKHPGAQEAGISLLAMQSTHVAELADRTLNTLSGGEKARVHLARALAQIWESTQQQPNRWLLLDEPTAALDLQHQHRMLRLARRWATEQGIGVVAVLHDLNLALRYADQAVLLAGGHLLKQGATQDVLTIERIGEVWGVAAHPVLRHGLLQYVFEPHSS